MVWRNTLIADDRRSTREGELAHYDAFGRSMELSESLAYVSQLPSKLRARNTISAQFFPNWVQLTSCGQVVSLRSLLQPDSELPFRQRHIRDVNEKISKAVVMFIFYFSKVVLRFVYAGTSLEASLF